MKYVNCNILSAVDTASHNGSQVSADQLISASFMAYFGDATATGTLKIQASNDPCPFGYVPQSFVVTEWVDIPNATASVTSGASVLITIDFMCYRWVRAVYTRASGGSTTINVLMNAQSV